MSHVAQRRVNPGFAQYLMNEELYVISAENTQGTQYRKNKTEKKKIYEMFVKV